MEPIALNEYGESMDAINSETDESSLPISLCSYAGVHESDNGFVYALPVSETHYVIRCAICGRITRPIPKEVNTYGKLRGWCAQVIASDKAHRNEVAKVLSDHQTYG
jgi:hypothetical protein